MLFVGEGFARLAIYHEQAARLAVIKSMQALSAKDVSTIPYWQGKMIAVGRSNIQGISSTLDAAFYMRFWLLSKS